MILQIKSLSGELSEEEKKYIRKSMLWFEEHLPNNTVLTVGVREHITKKSNQAFEIILHTSIPKVKKPLYVRVFRNSLNEAVNLAKEKMERTILKNKERFPWIKFKLPQKVRKLWRKNEEST